MTAEEFVTRLNKIRGIVVRALPEHHITLEMEPQALCVCALQKRGSSKDRSMSVRLDFAEIIYAMSAEVAIDHHVHAMQRKLGY